MSNTLVIVVTTAFLATTLFSISHSKRQSNRIKRLQDSLSEILVQKILLEQEMEDLKFQKRILEETGILRKMAGMSCAKVVGMTCSKSSQE